MLWIDFVNSHARNHLGQGPAEDRLDNPAWIKQFAEKWELRPTQIKRLDDRERLRRLRSLLQRWVEEIVAGKSISDNDIHVLNRYLTARAVRPQLNQKDQSFQLDLVSTATGIEAWLFAIAASFARFLVDQDPTRLKTCDNPNCLWVFYDDTRSRTRRWCAVSCGDLIKVREFRKRKRPMR